MYYKNYAPQKFNNEVQKYELIALKSKSLLYKRVCLSLKQTKGKINLLVCFIKVNNDESFYKILVCENFQKL